jgi:hypothetical protein
MLSNVPTGTAGTAARHTASVSTSSGVVNEHERGLLATLTMISTPIEVHADARGADHSERFRLFGAVVE